MDPIVCDCCWSDAGQLDAHAEMRAIGEWEVRGDARAETPFHFRPGITSVVPRPVVSGSGSDADRRSMSASA
jgi:hypothetical protein